MLLIWDMLYSCKNLSELNLSSFNTNNVSDMSEMFSYCENLNLLKINKSNFKNFKNLKKIIDDSKFNITNVSKVDGIFHGCHKKMIDSNKSLFKKFNDNDLMKEFN